MAVLAWKGVVSQHTAMYFFVSIPFVNLAVVILSLWKIPDTPEEQAEAQAALDRMRARFEQKKAEIERRRSKV